MEQILYASAMASKRLFNHLLATAAKEKPSQPAQKFNQLVAEGMSQNGVKVTCLTGLPVTLRSHSTTSYVREEDEDEAGIFYHYVHFRNKPLMKYLQFLFGSFIYTLSWGRRNRNAECAIICDVLCMPLLIGCFLASKLLRIPMVGVITDLPGMISGNRSLSGRVIAGISNFIVSRLSGQVPLTEQMCDVINKRHRPYIVVEGLCDKGMAKKMRAEAIDGKRHITYTGAIHKKYGLDTLAKGFMMTKETDTVLDIYGSGDMAETLKEYHKKDARVVYHGTVTIEDAVSAQLHSYLLVNPRPTVEDFTKYSFPSKTMEYMASGVPLLTTRLPGIPKDYNPYVYFIEREDAQGIADAIEKTLAKSKEENAKFGETARQFVLQKKNNVVQAKRILDFMDSL